MAVVVLLAASGWAKTGKTAASTKPAEAAPQVTLEPQALEILKAAGARLASAKTLSFTATADYEYPSRLGPPLVYAMRYDVVMARPDKLKVVIPGDGPASEFYCDGKEMAAFVPAENLAAVAEAAPTIEATLKKAFDTADIYFPFTDLLVADPYTALTEGMTHVFSVGTSMVVGGTKTDIVAVANGEVFLQLWIGAEDRLPRRIRAVYQADPLRLRHDLELADWKLDIPVAAEVFVSQPAHAANRIGFARPALTPAPQPRAKPSKP
ncbi:putative membrane protein [Desulfovibrio sp. TomC]|nr:putative membrane protein [Desulfovibrio sp. TomC]